MKIKSGHLTLLILFMATLFGAHWHADDIRRLAGPGAQEKRHSPEQATVDSNDRIDDKTVHVHTTQCWWPPETEENIPPERIALEVDGTPRRLTLPVWRPHVTAPRAVRTVEIVDGSGNRWRLISGGTEGLQKEVQLTGRISHENGETYFVHEDGNACFGRWVLVTEAIP